MEEEILGTYDGKFDNVGPDMPYMEECTPMGPQGLATLFEEEEIVTLGEVIGYVGEGGMTETELWAVCQQSVGALCRLRAQSRFYHLLALSPATLCLTLSGHVVFLDIQQESSCNIYQAPERLAAFLNDESETEKCHVYSLGMSLMSARRNALGELERMGGGGGGGGAQQSRAGNGACISAKLTQFINMATHGMSDQRPSFREVMKSCREELEGWSPVAICANLAALIFQAVFNGDLGGGGGGDGDGWPGPGPLQGTPNPDLLLNQPDFDSFDALDTSFPVEKDSHNQKISPKKDTLNAESGPKVSNLDDSCSFNMQMLSSASSWSSSDDGEGEGRNRGEGEGEDDDEGTYELMEAQNEGDVFKTEPPSEDEEEPDSNDVIPSTKSPTEVAKPAQLEELSLKRGSLANIESPVEQTEVLRCLRAANAESEFCPNSCLYSAKATKPVISALPEVRESPRETPNTKEFTFGISNPRKVTPFSQSPAPRKLSGPGYQPPNENFRQVSASQKNVFKSETVFSLSANADNTKGADVSKFKNRLNAASFLSRAIENEIRKERTRDHQRTPDLDTKSDCSSSMSSIENILDSSASSSLLELKEASDSPREPDIQSKPPSVFRPINLNLDRQRVVSPRKFSSPPPYQPNSRGSAFRSFYSLPSKKITEATQRFSGHQPVFAKPRVSGSGTPKENWNAKAPSWTEAPEGIIKDTKVKNYLDNIVEKRSKTPPNVWQPKKRHIPVGLAHMQIRGSSEKSSSPPVFEHPAVRSKIRSSSPTVVSPAASERSLYLGSPLQESRTQLRRSSSSLSTQDAISTSSPVNLSLDRLRRLSSGSEIMNDEVSFNISKDEIKNAVFQIDSNQIRLQTRAGEETTILRANQSPIDIQICGGGVNISFGAVGGQDYPILGSGLIPVKSQSTMSLNSIGSSRFSQSFQRLNSMEGSFVVQRKSSASSVQNYGRATPTPTPTPTPTGNQRNSGLFSPESDVL